MLTLTPISRSTREVSDATRKPFLHIESPTLLDEAREILDRLNINYRATGRAGSDRFRITVDLADMHIIYPLACQLYGDSPEVLEEEAAEMDIDTAGGILA